jgi:hypothetical protein
VTAEGRPNLSPKGTTTLWDEEHLMFADLASPATIEPEAHSTAVDLARCARPADTLDSRRHLAAARRPLRGQFSAGGGSQDYRRTKRNPESRETRPIRSCLAKAAGRKRPHPDGFRREM